MTAVTKTTLVSEPWTTVRNLLKNNLVDPKGRFKKTIVFAAIPDTSDTKFIGYPFVVVEPFTLEQENAAFDRDQQMVSWSGTVVVYSLDDQSIVDNFTDQIIKIVNANKATFNTDGLFNVRLNVGSFAQIDFNGQRVFTRNLNIQFNRKMGVA